MIKLYPPYLEGTIPAFYGDSITVPFAMNRAVGKNEISNFSLLIKTIQTGQQIDEIKATKYDLSNGTATFKLNETNYLKGQSYKLQLAYINKSNEIGYYSTIGIAKYTTQPKINIKNLNKAGLNNHIYNYIGEYETSDITEKMYSCQFKVYDQNKNIIEDSGEIIHNSLNDEAPAQESSSVWWYKASEQFDLNQELDSGKNYYIQFLVKTVGLMELDTGLYQIVQGAPIPTQNTIIVDTYLNYDNGYIGINMKHYNGTKMTGKYALSRSSSKDNFKSWNEIMRFTLNGEEEREIWKDFTIEHGVQYKYSVFMIDSNGNYSTKAISNIILSDFEDMFLFDGDRQLKIRFNPKVSSFKAVKLESKTDTIGGKYPYIFRNGYVDYKEFGVGGLISHLTDTDGYFESALAQTKYGATNSLSIGGIYSNQLNTENFVMERDFKLEVLNWLNNGEPKLFRSPAEGNYIVRLMNVSLSPTDSLSRMIHTFSSTAYEIKEYTHKNLVETGLIKDNLLIGLNPIITGSNTINSLKLLSVNSNYLDEKNLTNVIGIRFNLNNIRDVWVEVNGSNINVKLTNEINFPIYSLKAVSGQTYLDTDKFTLLIQTEALEQINPDINKIDLIDIPLMNFCGWDDIYETINVKTDLMKKLIKIDKEYINEIFCIKCTPRIIYNAYTSNWFEFFNDAEHNNPITLKNDCLYRIYDNYSRVIGYYDNGKDLRLSDWTTLEDLDNLYKITIGNKSWRNITQEKIITSEDLSGIDFTNTSIYGSLFLNITFSCRVASTDFVIENAEYGNNIQAFEDLAYTDANGNIISTITTQEGLNTLLNQIFGYFGGSV